MAAQDSSMAESMKAQVLMTTISASSGSAQRTPPFWTICPRRTSLSTRFLAQPRLTKETRKGLGFFTHDSRGPREAPV